MSKITDFFKQSKNSRDQIEEIVEKRTIAKQFYEKCVSIQDQSCNKVDCINTLATLKYELKAMQEKCLNIKEAIEICTEVVAEKDIEIQNLMQQLAINATAEPAIVGVEEKSVPVDDSFIPVGAKPADIYVDYLFSAFQSDFSVDYLSLLRSVDIRSEKDSHFVNVAMKALYEGRYNILQNKSVTGRSKTGQTKEAVTPEKHRILTKIYSERIFIATQDSAERVLRKKKLNKYIKDAIHNITKTVDLKELEKKTCQRLADNFIE